MLRPTSAAVKGGKRVFLFGGDPQRRPAGRHDAQVRAALHQPGHLGRGRHDLLQVVQEQERLPLADQGDKPSPSVRPSASFTSSASASAGRKAAGR